MSTAERVPETFELTGDDAWRTLSHCGRGRLLKDAFQRLRVADGFSHARALAFATALVLVQGLISMVGLAAAIGSEESESRVSTAITSAVPGPAGELVRSAVDQARSVGDDNRYLGLILGLVGAILTGTVWMGQMERALNRIYGIEKDRDSVAKYINAAVLCLTAGALATVGFGSIALGQGVGSLFDGTAHDVWSVLRWPIGLTAMMATVGLLFRHSPRRRQPSWSWMMYGAIVAVVLWAVFTVALLGFFRSSSNFGQTYGSLAGVVALLLWSNLSGIAILYGGAAAAQLEAVRAGAPGPQDQTKVAHSEPELEAAGRVGA